MLVVVELAEPVASTVKAEPVAAALVVAVAVVGDAQVDESAAESDGANVATQSLDWDRLTLMLVMVGYLTQMTSLSYAMNPIY